MIGNGLGNEGESGDGQLIEQIIDTSQPGPTTILVITVYSTVYATDGNLLGPLPLVFLYITPCKGVLHHLSCVYFLNWFP